MNTIEQYRKKLENEIAQARQELTIKEAALADLDGFLGRGGAPVTASRDASATAGARSEQTSATQRAASGEQRDAGAASNASDTQRGSAGKRGNADDAKPRRKNAKRSDNGSASKGSANAADKSSNPEAPKRGRPRNDEKLPDTPENFWLKFVPNRDNPKEMNAILQDALAELGDKVPKGAESRLQTRLKHTMTQLKKDRVVLVEGRGPKTLYSRAPATSPQ